MVLDIRVRQVGSLFSEGLEDGAPQTTLAERRATRERLFDENFPAFARRVGGGLVHALRPGNWRALFSLVDFLVRERAIMPSGLPDPGQTLREPDGLCGLVQDTRPEALMEAYGQGLAPQGRLGPLRWFCPHTRLVSRPAAVPLAATLPFTCKLDRNFDELLVACARSGGAWFQPRLMHAFARLHEAGFAHCVEVRNRDGGLVAGIIGVGVGGVFVIEGAFGPQQPIALAVAELGGQLERWGFALIDAKRDLRFAELGFRAMDREPYRKLVLAELPRGRHGKWRFARPMPVHAPLARAA